MVNRQKDSRVKEWMKDHKGEVEKVQRRYDELKEVSLQGLLEASSTVVIEKVRSLLISGIIASEDER